MRIGDILQQNSYGAKLRTDEWKSFARGFRSSHGNVCAQCRQGGKPIHVHHICYDPSCEPWEHQEADMILLCDSCHKLMHEQFNKFRRYVFGHFTSDSLRVLNGALAVALTKYDGLKFAYAVAEMASSPGSVERFFNAWLNGERKAKTKELNPSVPDFTTP